MRAPVLRASSTLPDVAFIFLCGCWIVLVAWTNLNVAELHSRNIVPNLPYGVFAPSDRAIYVQDLAYNTLFLRGVSERLVDRPYRLDDQEKMMRRMLPESTGGMTHAYSPVALVVALPFLPLSGAMLYFLYTLVCAASVLLLYYFYLMPRITRRLQVYAFLACALSLCVISQLRIGQSALITTSLIAALWGLVQQRSATNLLWRDVLIALIFWALCAKPNIALIPGVLLLGEQAWRPLALGAGMLLATWAATASYYGGAWTGLQDYYYLLNHYNNAEFSPYLARGVDTVEHKRTVEFLFAFDRAAVLAGSVALVILRWSGRIERSQLFHGMIWIFLLLSPYLMGSEYWLLCLLIVEAGFARPGHRYAAAVKFLMLAAIVDLREGITFPIDADFYLKWLLFTWIAIDTLAHWQASRARTTLAPRPELTVSA